MNARLVLSAAIAVAAAAALTWAPAASAQPSEPPPSAPAASAETPAPEAGRVEITTKDTAGDALPGATFLLLDSAGQEAGRGQSDAQGKVTFPDLAPGIYRLKQWATGSPLHEVVADQDVIVTPGATTRLTITDPFNAAQVLLQAKDDKTGKLLPGATVNIGTGTSTLLTLTTGAKGTASGELPVSSRRAQFWVKEIKAPAGYDLYQLTKTFTAGPGDPVTVTVTNTKTTTDPQPEPSGKPTHTPTDTPSSPGKPNSGIRGVAPSASSNVTPKADSSTIAATPVGDSTPKTPTGALARTGADATLWLIGGAAVLIAGGGGALAMARRSRTDSPADDSTES
ncbi:carboxypeptidase-like regulatory domain-containing protein [Streptomyces sp. NPDC052071]|uniref:MSCRAMM family protein n=1 Tax=Streptomyces TaxID=1883 RepID=UPI0029B53841|nr:MULTISPECIES: carboxypeptidase-like regulatory domain-containing protein [unclassified Streptomyces]MDX2621276.1 carboxypeptidase-like regulatory domain-containing protein [Streptomyces sp. WI03-5b]MDX3180585.1 carboxypeptidase-like regulatory domain-containing protein [Streptomyces sp. ME02-7008A-1]MDX3301326.1 carboxypeptidase-like regulatory domain-containing protein [Streptomyces sp. ME02-7008A]